MPDNAAADFGRGLTALKAGDRSGAFSGFLMALALDPDNPLYQKHALDILETTGGYTTLPEPILDALAGCARNPDLDLQPLSLVVKILLPHRADIDECLTAASSSDTDFFNRNVDAGLFDGLASDPIICAVLRRCTNVSVILEDLLTGIRRHSLTSAAAGQPPCFLIRHPTFFSALTVQADRTDFAWAESASETDLLNKVGDSGSLQDVLLSYRHPPPTLSQDFPVMTPISDPVSQIVQAQYVAYPYPRWETLPPITPKSLRQAMENLFPKETWPNRFGDCVSGLSAGCGTGRGAIMLARSIRNLKLTAMDLSPNSLAFAADKARALGVTGIVFGLGDILESGSLMQTFDLIECSGVLHHMDDPLAGLIALKKNLANDGVMRIALYSERARSAVVAARRWIADEEVEDSKNGLRQARAGLRALPENHPARPVVETPDFFNLSGLHDLVFNVQEHRFTPTELKQLLDQSGLRFLGFDHVNLAVPAQYETMFGPSSSKADLDNWESFEQNHPDTFAEMYQMWCRPIGS